MQAAIETKSLKRSFGAKPAVDGIDLMVPAGAVYGFLGPNGAGKTTTIRLLLGLARADQGDVSVLGLPMPSARAAILRRTGAMVEVPTHYDHLTGAENLTVTARLLGLPRGAIDRALAIVGLQSAAAQKVGGYSLGMRQRLGIARALLGRPSLLILDEPTNGLDPDGIRDVRALLRRLPAEQGCTVMVSSHLLAEVEQTATHIGLMWRGRLVTQGPIDNVIAGGGDLVEIDVDRVTEAALLLTAHGLSVCVPGPDRIEVRGNARPEALNARLTSAGISVSRLVRRQPTLEDLYLRLTQREALLEASQ